MNYDELIRDTRVLFLNGIRVDQLSGGNTSTQNLLHHWSSISHLYSVNLAPDQTKITLISYLIVSFPAIIFIVWSRYCRFIWLEFFSRFSPLLMLYSIWIYWRIRPEVVIFNHHSTFFYSFFFKKSKCVFIWHDVPSFKKTYSTNPHRKMGRKFCAFVEKTLLNFSSTSLTFSFSEKKILKRLHDVESNLLPVLTMRAHIRQANVRACSWLLVGNWNRTENSAGATAFFNSYLELLATGNSVDASVFTIAGNGANFFLKNLHYLNPAIKILNIYTNSNYENLKEFSDSALLAPILEGAGIKVKTLEAWAYGIPVVGTAQAFSGLPNSIWQFGGIRVPSIEGMAKFCLNWKTSQHKLNVLQPNLAYQAYTKALAGDFRSENTGGKDGF